MTSGRTLLAVVSLAMLAAPGTAAAYVGPGLGVGAIAAILGAVLAILLAIVGVIWYPIKRMLGRNRPAKPDAGNASDQK